MDKISTIGAISSVIGAIVAIWQVQRVKKIRNEVLGDRFKIQLVEVRGKAYRAREECQKLTTKVGVAIRGVNPQNVIDVIRECLDSIKDHNHKFDDSDLKTTILTAEKHLKAYIAESEDAKRPSIADKMNHSISEIISSISKHIDRSI